MKKKGWGGGGPGGSRQQPNLQGRGTQNEKRGSGAWGVEDLRLPETPKSKIRAKRRTDTGMTKPRNTGEVHKKG